MTQPRTAHRSRRSTPRWAVLLLMAVVALAVVASIPVSRALRASHEQTAVHALRAFCGDRLASELPGYHFDPLTGGKTVMDTLGVLNLQPGLHTSQTAEPHHI